ncbi:uncharacterized protein LOC114352225 isoform X2 [Ostrinia furnacalis]|uniref:uncharacterized protein LOC114352225 isoform X1 n=1 Tax=Ostrinia furnacalis TaxID=93504 RepID=UPI001039B1E1|nr:uncharacterized protein LOC114352225 isoform X1 [Ostrinia furnacalis]XP_028159548.1 uncharacterized protein LOC114352225 isoform X2 [Ostrinia furnacalis]
MEITWHFNAPSWPSAGGLFEAAVKSFKYHFKRVVGEQKLTFEEFYTLLTQIEACLNSRPLCALSEDPDNLDFLTPAHFLTGGPLLTIVETERDMRTRLQLTQKIYQDIWKRWRSEYLTQLSSRSKWTQPSENINLNDVVIIQDDNLPPGKWLMGRVVELHPGQDGYVRVVTLKTKSGLIKRPVTKVARLIKQQENDNHEQQNEIKNTRKQEPKQTTNKTPTRKHTTSSILAACLLFMTLMTGAESKVNITKFRENQGLYFDKISNMQLIKDEWKLIVYYNMEPYEQGITALNTYLENLDKTCSSLHDQALCHAVLLQLRHGRDELEYYDQLLLSRQITTQPTQRRKRRGLINAIGSIASDLFGVLDERFAEQYKRDISLLQNNQKHMIQLWKNQTSIVEAENNLLKRTEDIINQQHKTLNQHINSLEKAINQLKGATEGNMILNNFAIGAIIASNMLASLKNLQNNLLDTITDTHQNRFNLHLMTPEQLMEELSTVSSQLPKDVTLPIENVHSDLRKIYNLLKIRARMLEDYLIFEIRIPLISRDSYELLKVIPIPKIQDEKSISIVPVSEYVSINMKKDTYIPMSESDVNACLLQFDMHFCHSWKPEYQLNEDKNLCEIEHSECKTQVNPCKNTWQESYATNTYIYFCCKQCNVRVMCGDQVTAHQLQAEGLVTVGHGCIIKTDKLSIFPHKTHSSEFKIWPNVYIPKMAPINNIINITIPHLTIENKSEELKQEAEKIEEKIKIAKAKGDEVLIEADNLSLHDIHHYVMIYVVVSIAGIIGVIMIIRRLRCKWHIPPSVAEPSIMMNELNSPSPVVQAAAAPRSSRTARQVDEYAVLERQVDRSTSPAPKRIIIPRSQADLHQ